MIQPGSLRILIDTMIPGHSNRWPAASDVIDAEALGAPIDAALSPAAAALVGGPLSASTAPALLERLAAEHPHDARSLAGAVYRAYYTTSAVQSVIRDLANPARAKPLPILTTACSNRCARIAAANGGSDMNEDNGPNIELLSPPDMFRDPTYEHAARVGDFIFIAGQSRRTSRAA